MPAYVPCSACQTCRVAVETDDSTPDQAVCLLCQLRQTRHGLDKELAATWQALGVAESAR